jgi:hypothetical protein
MPEVIPAQACHLGWQESLTLLTQLVEAEVEGEAVTVFSARTAQAAWLSTGGDAGRGNRRQGAKNLPAFTILLWLHEGAE